MFPLASQPFGAPDVSLTVDIIIVRRSVRVKRESFLFIGKIMQNVQRSQTGLPLYFSFSSLTEAESDGIMKEDENMMKEMVTIYAVYS